MKLYSYRSDSLHPHINQATEATLLDMCKSGEAILYLWQNDKTVFIGKNQNAYLECKVPVIEADGGFIARRISGGGAVYHDKGNINFTFVSAKESFDKEVNFKIMVSAMKSLGFDAELNGRNDVVIGGRKFSGNAFYHGEKNCFHHGTVLISTDTDMMSKYLSVPKVKLEAKGVKSVVSRVVNLSEINDTVTADSVAGALIKSFGDYYGEKVIPLDKSDLDEDIFARYYGKFGSEAWIKGDNVYYDARAVVRLSWGTADIRLKLCGNVISAARIYSDCLDVDEVEKKEKLLVGADLYEGKTGVNDILDAFKEQEHGF